MSDPYADGNGSQNQRMSDPCADGMREIWPEVGAILGPCTFVAVDRPQKLLSNTHLTHLPP